MNVYKNLSTFNLFKSHNVDVHTGDMLMDIFTVEPLYIIAAVLVAGAILALVKYRKGAVVAFIINSCEKVLEEVGGELKEKDPKQYEELMDLLGKMKKMTDERVSIGEIIEFVTVASVQFEKVAKKYGIEFSGKKK